MSGGDRHALGLWGEDRAARWLQVRGYRIVSRRYRRREGEVDLIAQRGDYLCFVEVKLRRDARMGEARESVDRRKQERLRAAATHYLLEHPTDLQPRFDVMEVYAPEGMQTQRPAIRHWSNAF